jgi:hypothetical protein
MALVPAVACGIDPSATDIDSRGLAQKSRGFPAPFPGLVKTLMFGGYKISHARQALSRPMAN